MNRIARLTLLFVLVPLLLLYLGAGLFLAQGKAVAGRHAPYPHAPFDFATGSFDDYIRYSRDLILASRDEAPDDISLGNLLPFELEPPDHCPRDAEGRVAQGIVLIHGLFDGPYSMRPFGEDLRARCLHVLGLLLPDHGTRPGDFLDARWEDWAAATRFAAAQMGQRSQQIILGGHSAGGALAVLDALRYPQADALILFAPALAITPSARYARFVTPLGRLFRGAGWFELGADEATYRYESITFSAAVEMYELTQAVNQAWHAQQRQLPVFTVASVEDSTVMTQAMLDFMALNRDPRSKTLLYSQHPHPGGNGIEVVSSHRPDQGILSVSHLGLMTPAEHPHYGRDGAYRNCGYKAADSAGLRQRCQAGGRDYYGETTAENLALGLVERIAFNPWYPEMLQDIEMFLDGLEP